jgi:hypothetical protein
MDEYGRGAMVHSGYAIKKETAATRDGLFLDPSAPFGQPCTRDADKPRLRREKGLFAGCLD